MGFKEKLMIKNIKGIKKIVLNVKRLWSHNSAPYMQTYVNMHLITLYVNMQHNHVTSRDKL